MAAGDVALLREPGLDPHEDGMAAAVDVEDFLARERDLHRAPRELRELARRDLVRERIQLAPEPAADRRRDHADVRAGHVQDLREQAVHVVRRLRGRPQGQLAVRAPVGDGGVLLHRQVRVALEVEDVLAHEVGARERGVDITELQRDVLVDVGPVAVLVDAHLGMGERRFDRHECRQGLVVDLDQLTRALGRLFVDGGHRRDRVADHPDLLHTERFLVLGHGQDAELHAREIGARDDAEDTRQRARPRRVDPRDARVGMGAAQQLAVRHARHDEVVGVPGLAGDLRPRVDLRKRLPDDGEFVFRRHGAGTRARSSAISPLASPRGAPRLALRPAPVLVLMRRLASSTASRIFV